MLGTMSFISLSRKCFVTIILLSRFYWSCFYSLKIKYSTLFIGDKIQHTFTGDKVTTLTRSFIAIQLRGAEMLKVENFSDQRKN